MKQNFGFRVSGLGFGVSGFRLSVERSVFRVLGLSVTATTDAGSSYVNPARASEKSTPLTLTSTRYSPGASTGGEMQSRRDADTTSAICAAVSDTTGKRQRVIY